MTDAVPYKVFGETERAALQEAVGAAVEAWREAWLPAAVRLRSECAPAAELGEARPAAGWTQYSSGARGWWLSADAAARRSLGAALCGAGESSELGGAVAAVVLRELASRLLGGAVAASPGEDVPPPAHLWRKASAATALRVSLGESRIHLVSTPEWTQAVLRERLPRPAPAALESRRAAVSDRRVALQVVAGWVELELGALRGLAAGNVIALGTHIDTPLSVVRPGRAAPLFSARLGSSEGSRAIAAQGVR